MDYSKQKLMLTLLTEFELSFTKQINESNINQETSRYLEDKVREMRDKQYRGSLFDKEVEQIIKKINQAQADDLVFNDYTKRLWKVIVQISKRTTSFETAYSLIDILSSKNASFKL
ncbi:hypothetical protein [Companilactobacillus halodurans]|uniref:Uncharacterized protein n=1 Tax=Companilactobacillus halodurans TaxID=2584183 RepID=A0A5P0ZM30_9LACO|nr:hypothetical protein [Companilactobacillus halodurans]MQS75242.1 hypothetical protein [Companilactobacillus halodurans]MQS97942.1 hypothetical protein [Companilactobacillus halodurans]